MNSKRQLPSTKLLSKYATAVFGQKVEVVYRPASTFASKDIFMHLLNTEMEAKVYRIYANRKKMLESTMPNIKSGILHEVGHLMTWQGGKDSVEEEVNAHHWALNYAKSHKLRRELVWLYKDLVGWAINLKPTTTHHKAYLRGEKLGFWVTMKRVKK